MSDNLTSIEILKNDAVKTVLQKYNEHTDEYKNAGFNVFNLISDMYYRENLHSDIIAAFLDPKENHEEGDRFLKVFLNLLKQIRNDLIINEKDFMNASVNRESHKIDILIKDTETNKAIIIENKINDASDTKRQLPTYVEKIGKENVIAIVYLPLSLTKEPDKKDWGKEEKEFIESKLVKLPAFNRTNRDFYNGWLQQCIDQATNEDSKSILKQYSKLIFKIGGQQMSQNSLKELYNEILLKNELWKDMISVSSITREELPIYRAKKIHEDFQNEKGPFNRLGLSLSNRQVTISFLGYTFKNRIFQIHINCNIQESELKFYDQGYTEIENDGKVLKKYTSVIVEKLKERGVHFEREEINEYVRCFSFPEQEKELYEFIKRMQEELKKIQDT